MSLNTFIDLEKEFRAT